jgi:hypothetical protein
MSKNSSRKSKLREKCTKILREVKTLNIQVTIEMVCVIYTYSAVFIAIFLLRD